MEKGFSFEKHWNVMSQILSFICRMKGQREMEQYVRNPVLGGMIINSVTVCDSAPALEKGHSKASTTESKVLVWQSESMTPCIP